MISTLSNLRMPSLICPFSTGISIVPISLHKTAEPSARKMFLFATCMFLQSHMKGVMWTDAALSMTQPLSRSESGI